jgi:hypothetical protein
MQFKIEQVALYPRDPHAAIALLSEMGLSQWAHDHVVARGHVFPDDADTDETKATNEADLAFNYQATQGIELGAPVGAQVKPLELEVLHYTKGLNWMDEDRGYHASHLGMHVDEHELDRWTDFFLDRGIGIAQEVRTQSHTNPHIKDSRRYHYVIFDTHSILGIDIKFIVRHAPGEPGYGA